MFTLDYFYIENVQNYYYDVIFGSYTKCNREVYARPKRYVGDGFYGRS